MKKLFFMVLLGIANLLIPNSIGVYNTSPYKIAVFGCVEGNCPFTSNAGSSGSTCGFGSSSTNCSIEGIDKFESGQCTSQDGACTYYQQQGDSVLAIQPLDGEDPNYGIVFYVKYEDVNFEDDGNGLSAGNYIKWTGSTDNVSIYSPDQSCNSVYPYYCTSTTNIGTAKLYQYDPVNNDAVPTASDCCRQYSSGLSHHNCMTSTCDSAGYGNSFSTYSNPLQGAEVWEYLGNYNSLKFTYEALACAPSGGNCYYGIHLPMVTQHLTRIPTDDPKNYQTGNPNIHMSSSAWGD